jgi:hypothetical protein
MEQTNSNDKSQQKEIRLVDIEVTDENTALNLLVGFLSLAQKRGTFSIDESSKIWECIKIFQKSPPPPPPI